MCICWRGVWIPLWLSWCVSNTMAHLFVCKNPHPLLNPASSLSLVSIAFCFCSYCALRFDRSAYSCEKPDVLLWVLHPVLWNFGFWRIELSWPSKKFAASLQKLQFHSSVEASIFVSQSNPPPLHVLFRSSRARLSPTASPASRAARERRCPTTTSLTRYVW